MPLGELPRVAALAGRVSASDAADPLAPASGGALRWRRLVLPAGSVSTLGPAPDGAPCVMPCFRFHLVVELGPACVPGSSSGYPANRPKRPVASTRLIDHDDRSARRALIETAALMRTARLVDGWSGRDRARDRGPVPAFATSASSRRCTTVRRSGRTLPRRCTAAATACTPRGHRRVRRNRPVLEALRPTRPGPRVA